MTAVSVAAVVALTALLGAGALSGYPALRERRDSTDLEPGLLQVDPVARGEVSLGDGVYVVLGPGGLTISRRRAVVYRSVDRGALVTAGLGHLDWRGADPSGAGVLRAREVIDHALGNVRITERRHDGAALTYSGRVFAGDDLHGSTSRALSVTVTRRAGDSRVLLDVSVPGADVVTVHEFRRPEYTYRGVGEQFASRGLRAGRWPVVTRAQGIGRGQQPLTVSQDLSAPDARGGDAAATPAPMPFAVSSALSGIGLDSTAYAVVDLTHGGRLDLSVWSPRLRARLYDAATPRDLVVQHTADVGRMTAAPRWSTFGAVVGVSGGSARVRRAVRTVRAGGAVIAAVLVRDGGDRRRYPDWDALVAELRAAGVRTMTTVAPSLSPTRRSGGPDDEAALYEYAGSRGWLVTGASGAVAAVATGGAAGDGSTRGALVDLTNPDAVAWYAGVLGARLRADGLTGWLATGGADLPMDARLAHGTAATEHNAWPTRWAQLTDAACRVAGIGGCLVLQDTAAERTPGWAGVFSQSEQVTDWSAQDGLASVLPAKLSAGLSGMTQVHSGVGGWSSPSIPLQGRVERSDELLARWAELEAFGSLLRSEDGADPTAMPQVWDSPARLAAFARATRLFAAMARYRQQVVAAAAHTGLPVVRPFWLEEPNLRQAGADEEYFFGASLLVVPVLRPGEREVRAALGAGRWVELFSGRQYDGPVVQPPAPMAQWAGATTPPPSQVVTIPAPLGQPVVLYRMGDPQGLALHDELARAGLLRPPGRS